MYIHIYFTTTTAITTSTTTTSIAILPLLQVRIPIAPFFEKEGLQWFIQIFSTSLR